MSDARSRGFTLVELLIVVTIIALLAAIALPRLGGKGRGAAATDDWSRTITVTLDQLRTRALTERRNTRATLTNTAITMESWNGSAYVVEQTRRAPNQARTWDLQSSGAPPTAIMTSTTSHTIEFTPTFSIKVDGSSTTLNAAIYVATDNPAELKRGRQYRIDVIASGAVSRADNWW